MTAEAHNPKPETTKLTERAKPFAAVAQCTAKKEPGTPDKDLGTYATAYDAYSEIANF